MRILVTGATGAVGIPLVDHIVDRHDEVIVLVRRGRTDAEIRKLFRVPVSIARGDTTEIHCGASPELIHRYAGKVQAVVHAAGKVQYHERLRADTYRTNVGGAQNVIDLALELEVPRLVFISTAYVAGKAPYFGEDEVGAIETANNPYEGSKIEAERLVRQFPGASLIIRPSTIIGDSRSGNIAGVGGYAGFVKGFWSLRDRLRKYPHNPFYVGINPASTLNLVPNDWVVTQIRNAVISNVSGTVHLTHPEPVGMGWLFDETFGRWLKVPVTYDHRNADLTSLFKVDPIWRKTQEFITRQIVDYFNAYVTRDTMFGHERVKLIPGYVPPPTVNEEVIGAQMRYMLQDLFPTKKLEVVAA